MLNIRILSTLFVAALLFPLADGSLSAPQGDQEQKAEIRGTIVTSFEETSYPYLARLARIEGVVVVRVNLDDDGKVVSASAVSGHDLLVRQALPNIRKWRFRANSSKTGVVIYDFKFAEGTCGTSRGQLFVFRKPNVAEVIACPEPAQPDSK